jgi:glutamate---cysteine ligase / carboxylate-amine ligase
LQDVSALLALIHCLARDAATDEQRHPDPPSEILEEAMFRAARFGVTARLPDESGALHPVSELLEALLPKAREHAADLSCEAELDGLGDLLERGGGAGRQRAVYEIAGIDALLRELLELTGPRER